jgi:hypothetical protein
MRKSDATNVVLQEENNDATTRIASLLGEAPVPISSWLAVQSFVLSFGSMQ